MKNRALIISFVILIINIFIVTTLSAQDFCETTMSSESSRYYLVCGENVESDPPYYLRVYFHVIRKEDHQGGQSISQVQETFNILNRDFNIYDIYFVWDGCINYIEDDVQYETPSTSIWSTGSHDNGIDIYLGDTSSVYKGVARAYSGIEDGILLVSGTWDSIIPATQSSIVTHEMGHVLGLYHTHFPYCDNDFFISQPEPTNSLQCDPSIHGDYVCDTPADPLIWHNVNHASCEWTGEIKDTCGGEPFSPEYPLNEYDPDERNYMAYTWPLCMEHFSQGQVERMYCAIETKTFLQNALTEENGPEYCGCQTQDIHIYDEKIYNTEVFVGGNIYIHDGGSLIIKSMINFGESSEVIVEDGGKLTISGGILQNCISNELWIGIKVNSGAEITLDEDAKVKNSMFGIQCLDGSIVAFENCEIIGNYDNDNWYSVNGILLEDVQVQSFQHVKIKNCYRGVFINPASTTYFLPYAFILENIEINNAYYGIDIQKATGIIFNIVVTNSQFPVNLYKSPFTSIFGNQLGYLETGIRAIDSDFIQVYENTIGTETETGDFGIDLVRCNSAIIHNNPLILAKNIGVKGTGSGGLTIQFNKINAHNDNPYANKVAVQLSGCSYGDVNNNYLNQWGVIYFNQNATGVELVEGQSNQVYNNQLFYHGNEFELKKRFGGIRNLASDDAIIEENEIIGNGIGAGILTTNATGNVFKCNNIDLTKDGLNILHNSEGQTIWGNEFLDSEIDLTIYSEIGQQDHLGNKFYNGSTRAYGLSFLQLENSIFLVNDSISYHMPSDPIPDNNEWFVPEIKPDKNCQDVAGPGFYDDEERLCKYFIWLKTLESTSPKLFLIKLFHLLAYEQTKEGYELPDCIKNDPVFMRWCGLDELVSADKELMELNTPLDERDSLYRSIAEILDLMVDFRDTSDPQLREDSHNKINDALTTIKSSWVQKQLQNEIKLNETSMTIDSIDCQDSLIMIWKDVMHIYLDFLSTQYISPEQKIDLENISKLCSDEYGDKVHLARSLMSYFDETYYDQYDGCLDAVEPRSMQKQVVQPGFCIVPNPNDGRFTVYLEKANSGTVQVLDMNGRIILEEVIQDKMQVDMTLQDKMGVYLVRINYANGEEQVKKLVLNQ
jgi:hypothetical protein